MNTTEAVPIIITAVQVFVVSVLIAACVGVPIWWYVATEKYFKRR